MNQSSLKSPLPIYKQKPLKKYVLTVLNRRYVSWLNFKNLKITTERKIIPKINLPTPRKDPTEKTLTSTLYLYDKSNHSCLRQNLEHTVELRVDPCKANYRLKINL